MLHDRPGALIPAEAGALAYEAGKPIVLISTVWEGDQLTNTLLSHLALVIARESLSSKEIESKAVRVVPDFVFESAVELLFGKNQKAQKGVLIIDDVRVDISTYLARHALMNGLRFVRMEPGPSLHSIRWNVKGLLPFLIGGCTPPI